MRDRATSSIVRHRGARLLWGASACCSLVVWSTQIAVAVQVLRQHSVATLAVVVLAASLPALVLTPVAGVWADRYDVRRLSLLVMGAQVVCVGLLAGFIQTSLIAVTALYAAQGMLATLWPPTRQRWLYAVVPLELRPKANAAIGSINGLMTLIGAASGGLLSSWSPAVAVGAAGVVQTVSFVLLLLVGQVKREQGSQAERGTGSIWAQLREGARAARDYPLARSVVWIGIAWGLIGGGYNVLLAGHVTQDLKGDGLALGVAYAADGLSVIVATVLAGRLDRARHLPVYGAAYVVQGAAWALTFALSRLEFVLVGLIVMRLASGFIIALDTSILLDTVPDRMRGRITSLHMTTYNAVARVSLGALGGVLTVTSVPVVGVANGVCSVLVGAVWWGVSGKRSKALYLAPSLMGSPSDLVNETT